MDGGPARTRGSFSGIARIRSFYARVHEDDCGRLASYVIVSCAIAAYVYACFSYAIVLFSWPIVWSPLTLVYYIYLQKIIYYLIHTIIASIGMAPDRDRSDT